MPQTRFESTVLVSDSSKNTCTLNRAVTGADGISTETRTPTHVFNYFHRHRKPNITWSWLSVYQP